VAKTLKGCRLHVAKDTISSEDFKGLQVAEEGEE